jgi:hypothetical protein
MELSNKSNDTNLKRNFGITCDAMNGIILSAVSAHSETIEAAAESGCIPFNWGVELGDQRNEETYISRSKEYLDQSPNWQERFKALYFDHLYSNEIQTNNIPTY